MVLAFHGVSRGPDGSATNPQTLNDYFKLDSQCTNLGCISRGYLYGNVRWGAVSQYSREANARLATPILNFDGRSAFDASILQSEIMADRPVILAEPGHFVAATGILLGTFAINDPFYDRARLDDPAYGNSASAMVRFSKTHTDLSSVQVGVLAPSQVLVTDPSGRRVGFSPSGSILTEVPSSSYFFEEALADDTSPSATSSPAAGTSSVVIAAPQAGLYVVEVISPTDVYAFGVFASDREARLTLHAFEARRSASPPRYTLMYDPTPGATTLREDVPLVVELPAVL